MYKLRFTIFKILQVVVLLIFLCWSGFASAQTKSKTKSNSTKTTKKTVKPPVKLVNKPLPHTVFFQLIDSSEMLSVNHATEFKHVDVPKKMQNNFTAYIKDSVATEVSGLKSLLYYQYTMKDGRYIIGDIYFNNQVSYIVFKIYDKKYINYFTKDGIEQLKSIFKL